MGTGELENELVDTKKAVIQSTIPELINHIRYACSRRLTYHVTIGKLAFFTSGINLETAATISELIVDRTLDELDSCTIKLVLAHHGCLG